MCDSIVDLSAELPSAPRPTQQGESSLCTRHALGNAVVNAGEKQGIEFPLKSAIDVLVNSTDDQNVEKGAFPDQFDTSKLMKPLVLQDESTTVWWYVELQVKKCDYADHNGRDEFVLVYSVPGGGPHARHCVFIEKLVAGSWGCINSWGDAVEPRPQIPVNKPDNAVYKVVVTLRDSRIKDVISAVEAAYKSGGEEAVRKETEKHLDQWKFQKINLAVTGASGSGKSTIINTLRGIECMDVGAAEIGVKETTMKPTMYRFPENHNLKIWDLPGSHTAKFPTDQYCEKVDELLQKEMPGMKFDQFDAIILMSETRFTDTDHTFAALVDKIGKPLFFVRTKIDQDIYSMKKQRKQAPEVTLADIKQDCEDNLKSIKNKKIFYISGMLDDRDKWDYDRLHSCILNSLEDLQKNAFLYSIQAFNGEIVLAKKAALERRIPWRNASRWAVWGPAVGVGLLTSLSLMALPAAAGAMAKAAGLKETGAKLYKAAWAVGDDVVRPGRAGVEATAGNIVRKEVMFQQEQLAIDEKAVADLAADTGKTEQQIRQDIHISTGPRTHFLENETEPASNRYEYWCVADLYKELTLNVESALKKLECQKNITKYKM